MDKIDSLVFDALGFSQFEFNFKGRFSSVEKKFEADGILLRTLFRTKNNVLLYENNGNRRLAIVIYSRDSYFIKKYSDYKVSIELLSKRPFKSVEAHSLEDGGLKIISEGKETLYYAYDLTGFYDECSQKKEKKETVM